jgi:flagellar P-ring protein FlgI
MERRARSLLIVLCLLLVTAMAVGASSRVKDVAQFEGVRDNELVGYGLVVGLNGTGDRSQTFFSTQTLANLLLRSGVTVTPLQIRVKNIAAVMVTAILPPFARQGSRIDVTVSSIGDAQSLQGGVLIMTPLNAANGTEYVTAQGQVLLGGFSAGGRANKVETNHPTVGRIPAGGLIQKEVLVDLTTKSTLNLVLRESDFTTATRTARAVNDAVGETVAEAVDGRTIRVGVPVAYSKRVIEYMAMVENARMDVDNRARVIVNEKTGTIVMGKDVQISGVSIIHGNLSVQVGTVLNVSQPAPFGRGQTTVVPERTVTAQEDKAKTVSLREGASVEELIQSLNSIGASPRDVVAILQSIKAQGALLADIEII